MPKENKGTENATELSQEQMLAKIEALEKENSEKAKIIEEKEKVISEKEAVEITVEELAAKIQDLEKEKEEAAAIIDEQNKALSEKEIVGKNKGTIVQIGSKKYLSTYPKLKVPKDGILVAMDVQDIFNDEAVCKELYSDKEGNFVLPNFLTEIK